MSIIFCTSLLFSCGIRLNMFNQHVEGDTGHDFYTMKMCYNMADIRQNFEDALMRDPKSAANKHRYFNEKTNRWEKFKDLKHPSLK